MTGARWRTTLAKQASHCSIKWKLAVPQRLLYEFLNPELRNLPSHHPRMKFRANRSLRDVEPSVNLWMKKLDGDGI